MLAHTHARTHAHTHIHTYTTLTHIHTRTHTHTHTHARTHTHTRSKVSAFGRFHDLSYTFTVPGGVIRGSLKMGISDIAGITNPFTPSAKTHELVAEKNLRWFLLKET